MTLRPIGPSFAVTLAGALACLAAGCDRPPAADSLKEWTPTDHHSTDDDKAGSGAQAPQQGAGQGQPGAGAGDNAGQLVDLTWRQACASCHGMSGRGDGQMGPMVQAPDLTRADWQSSMTDAQLFATIKTGKNKMPRFDLPDPVVSGLVARIRSLKAR